MRAPFAASICIALSGLNASAANAATAIDCAIDRLRDQYLAVKARKSASETVAEAIGRKPSALQLRVIEAQAKEADEVLTPLSLHQREGDLKKAGFTPDEVKTLRQKGILPNSVVQWKGPVPSKLKMVEAKLRLVDNKVISEAKAGKKLSYVVDSDNQVFVVDGDLALDPEALSVIRNTSGPVGSGGFIIKESGSLEYNPGASKFELKPSHGFDLSDDEVIAVVSKLEKSGAGLDFSRKPIAGAKKSKVYDCLEIMSAQNSGKNFLKDRVIADNAVAGFTFVTMEAAGAGRFDTEQGRKSMAADIIGGNISSVFNASLGKHLVSKNPNYWVALGTRLGTGYAQGEFLSHAVYAPILASGQGESKDKEKEESSRENASETAAAIKNFNFAHTLARVPINQALDSVFMNRLPEMLFNACKSDSKLKVLVSPTAIRIYERFGSSVIYYGARKAIVGD